MNNLQYKDPRDQGFYMPAEWHDHTCCWMAWPARLDLWPNINATNKAYAEVANTCLLYTSPSPRDRTRTRMPSSA